jgi:hypothetical protein
MVGRDANSNGVSVPANDASAGSLFFPTFFSEVMTKNSVPGQIKKS